MQLRKLIYYVKPPCSKCPYKLRQIQTTVNPCPQCKLKYYQDYEMLKKQRTEKYSDNEK